MTTDQELVRRALVLKEKSAYSQLVQRYQKEIRTYLMRLTRNLETADDLAQESFLVGFRNLTQLTDSKNYRAWIYKIAYREFLQWHRKQKERAGDFSEPIQLSAPIATRVELVSVLNQIRAEEQAAIVLCLGQEFSHSEAAKILQIPVGSVKSLILRAREKLGVLNG